MAFEEKIIDADMVVKLVQWWRDGIFLGSGMGRSLDQGAYRGRLQIEGG